MMDWIKQICLMLMLKMKNKTFLYVCRLLRFLVGLVFVISGITKLADLSKFELIVMEFGLVPKALIHLFSLVLPVFELLCGLLSMTGKLRRYALSGISVMLMSFLVAITYTIQSNRMIEDCGCFGSLLGNEVGWELFLQDFLLLFLTMFLVLVEEKKSNARPEEGTPVMAGKTAAAGSLGKF